MQQSPHTHSDLGASEGPHPTEPAGKNPEPDQETCRWNRLHLQQNWAKIFGICSCEQDSPVDENVGLT